MNYTAFDKLWFDEVKSGFKQNGYDISYNSYVFRATKRGDETTRFIIKIQNTKLHVTVPLQKNYEYTTTFSECYKAVDYILYHLNEASSQILNNYEIIDPEINKIPPFTTPIVN